MTYYSIFHIYHTDFNKKKKDKYGKTKIVMILI